MDFESTQKLDFLTADWPLARMFGKEADPFKIRAYRVGTIHGLYGNDKHTYYLSAIVNDHPGNGHLNDMFEWFENSCKRDKKNLVVHEFLNLAFRDHLLKKRGFLPHGDDVIKFYDKMK